MTGPLLPPDEDEPDDELPSELPEVPEEDLDPEREGPAVEGDEVLNLRGPYLTVGRDLG